MWTPQIESVEKTSGSVRTIVSFTSDVKGEESFNQEFFVTDLEQLKKLVQDRINRVQSDFKNADEIAKLIGQPLDTNVTPPEPTPDEKARIKYFADLATLNKMIDGIKAGIRKDTDPDYLAQLALVKSEFKPEYETING